MGCLWLLALMFGQVAIKTTKSDEVPYIASTAYRPHAPNPDTETASPNAYLGNKEQVLEHGVGHSGAMRHSDGEKTPHARMNRGTRQAEDTYKKSLEVAELPKALKNSHSQKKDGKQDPNQHLGTDTVAQTKTAAHTRSHKGRRLPANTQPAEDTKYTFVVPDYAHFDEGCPGDVSARHLKGTEERIEWKRNNISSVCTFLIDLGHQYGIVLQFLTAYLRRGDTRDKDDSLTVYRYEQGNERELRRVVGDIPVPPVVAYTNRVLIRLITHKETADHGQGHACTDKRSLRLGYKRYLLHELPPEVGKGRYNCCTPYIVPEALRCDMVMQCIDGEDELNYNCTYHEPHCEKGSVYGSFHNMSYCLQLRDSSLPPSPWEEFEGYRLGYLPDPDSKHLAATLISLAGYDETYVAFRNILSLTNTKPFYRFVRAWDTPVDQFIDFTQFQTQLLDPVGDCAVLRVSPYVHVLPVDCWKPRPVLFRRDITQDLPLRKATIILKPASQKIDKFPVKSCPEGTFVHPFHFCESDIEQAAWSLGNLPLFHCCNGRTVHYTLCCDGVNDCGDNTDEDIPECESAMLSQLNLAHPGDYITKNAEYCDQYISCDGRYDCIHGGDEEDCSDCKPGLILCSQDDCVPYTYVRQGLLTCQTQNNLSDVIGSSQSQRLHTETSSQSVHCKQSDNKQTRLRLDFDGYGLYVLTELAKGEACPETHFQCTISLCIPSFLVNNGYKDCPWPYADDESLSRSDLELMCLGYYRCYQYPLCIHPEYLCDGVYHCPLKDDERYCDMTCPQNCTCEGYAYTCQLLYDSTRYPRARYLDLSGSQQLPRKVYGKDLGFFITFLNLSFTDLTVADVGLLNNLMVLDLSHNHIKSWSAIGWPGPGLSLTHVNLSNNPIGPVLDNELTDVVRDFEINNLNSLNLENCGIRHLTKNSFRALLRLTYLNLKHNGIESVPEGIFSGLKQLKHLDVRGNRISLSNKNMFRGLQNLHILETDYQSVCCLYSHLYPESPTRITKCVAPEDELSSCSDLLRSDFYRVCLWIFSLLAILGNMGVLVYRLCLEAEGSSLAFRVLVANLCGSDFLMGVYLMMIGSADAYYRGQYVWKRETWTHSPTCQAAGFLALVSSEVSAFMICIITLDRLLVLWFPLKRHLHLTCPSAVVACSAAWLTGIVLAVVPLLPATGWEFYSQTGICLPLHVTRLQFPGKQYAFGIFIVLNFVLFLLIGIGQVFIYRAVLSTPHADRTSRRQQDMAIARRLLLIVFSDFCCWFPVGVIGLLASQDTPIPGEVNVAAAIFVLPLNSAINPFLYTLSMLLERRRKRTRENRLQKVLDRLHVEMWTWSFERLDEVVQHGERLKQSRLETQRSLSEQSRSLIAGPRTSVSRAVETCNL